MRKLIRQSKTGYTLIEALIVLLVVCSFVLLPTLMISNWQKKLECQFFYYQLEKSMLHLQQLAICDQKTTRVDLHPDKQMIAFTAVDEELPWKNLKVPPSVVLHSGHSIMFKGTTGNVSTNQPETGIPKIRFTDNSSEVIYQFQLGSGRFEKKERVYSSRKFSESLTSNGNVIWIFVDYSAASKANATAVGKH